MEDNYLWISGHALAQMRLLIEGAIVLFEDEASTLLHLAAKHKEYSASGAFDTIGTAIYDMREHIVDLQAAHTKEVLRECADYQSVQDHNAESESADTR